MVACSSGPRGRSSWRIKSLATWASRARVSGVWGRGGEGDLAEWLTDGGDVVMRTETGGERRLAGRSAAQASRCGGAPVAWRSREQAGYVWLNVTKLLVVSHCSRDQ
jgi:hypothetical protein